MLAAERRLSAAEIAEIVRANEETVGRWLKRYLAEGVEGLHDQPQPDAPHKATERYLEQLIHAVRRRSRSLGLPFSVWILQRLADYSAIHRSSKRRPFASCAPLRTNPPPGSPKNSGVSDNALRS